MVRTEVESLRLYPEGRACRYPTVRRLIEVFEDVQHHRLKVGAEPTVVFTTKLSPLQKGSSSCWASPSRPTTPERTKGR